MSSHISFNGNASIVVRHFVVFVVFHFVYFTRVCHTANLFISLMNILLHHCISSYKGQCNVAITDMSGKAERDEDVEKFLVK